jgi:hypothetical protein
VDDAELLSIPTEQLDVQVLNQSAFNIPPPKGDGDC